MKKISILCAAAIAAFTMASCQKAEPVSADEALTTGNVVSVDVKVNNLGGADTKAIKQGWSDGDKINIWYGTNAQKTPDLIIKYDGSAWTKDETATISGNTPAASGKLAALYEASNDFAANYSDGGYFNQSEAIAGANVYATPMGAKATSIDYTFADGVLTSSINSWTFLSDLQVVITGIDPSEAQNYALKVLYFNDSYSLTSSIGGYQRTSSGFNTNNYSGRYQLGTANADGVAFNLSFNYNSASDPTFVLFDRVNNVEMKFKALGKNLAKVEGQCVGVKFNKSKLVPSAAPFGGICYSFSGTTATVEPYNKFFTSSYSGAIVIPGTITVNGTNYTVTALARSCFYGCSGITSITLPETIQSIGMDAFSGCSGLTSLEIPKNVSSINQNNPVFVGCSNLNISVNSENTNFLAENGVLYGKDPQKIYWIQENLTGELVLRSDTRSMASNTCRIINLSKITFPAGFSGDHWGLGTSGMTAGGITLEYSDANYDAFKARYYNNWSNFTYYFGSGYINRVVLSISSADDADWNKYKALKDEFGFKNVVDRRTSEVY